MNYRKLYIKHHFWINQALNWLQIWKTLTNQYLRCLIQQVPICECYDDWIKSHEKIYV